MEGDERSATSAYVGGWAALTAAIKNGSSWSGREPNSAFLNLGDGRFVDASAVSGFDHTDDGRAVAATDWDLDGRLDVFVKNRTGPQLRFLHNQARDAGGFVAFRLAGRVSNRDAIGAVVELTAGGKNRVQQVVAGSGYLAQSTSMVHFGLGRATTIEALEIRWPGGEIESIQPPAVNGFYRIVEGTGRAEPVDVPRISFGDSEESIATPAPPVRVLLKTPLPLPPSLLEAFGVPENPGRGALVNLWAHWCEPCGREVRSYAGQIERLREESFGWHPVSLDEPGDRSAAMTWWDNQLQLAGVSKSRPAVFLDDGALRTLEILVEHVTGRAESLPIPANLLIDARGNLQMLYFGSVFPDRFLSDATMVSGPSLKPARRSLYPGRWYYRSERDYDALTRRLEGAGRLDAARFYRSLSALD